MRARDPDHVFSLSWATPCFLGFTGLLVYLAPYVTTAFVLCFAYWVGGDGAGSVTRARISSLALLLTFTLAASTLHMENVRHRELMLSPVLFLTFASAAVRKRSRIWPG